VDKAEVAGENKIIHSIYQIYIFILGTGLAAAHPWKEERAFTRKTNNLKIATIGRYLIFSIF
jgi:hypothetical protein